MPPEAPALTSLGDALVRFAFPDSSVQTSRHILALHWYVACRLVIEGGLDPDRIRPRPPITVERTRYGTFLHHDPGAAKPGERTIPCKTKKVDVTVTTTIGPALAVSLKGSHNAFRNLTNRMEEAPETAPISICRILHWSTPSGMSCAPTKPMTLLRSLIFASRTVATMCRMLLCCAAGRLRNPFAATGAPWSACPTGKTSEITPHATRRAV